MTDYVAKGAIVSPDGKYRYLLWREWRWTHDPDNWVWMYADQGVPKSVVFIMLNPSTADGNIDDPTIRKCVGFAKRWRYERIEVINLFAYRATKPIEMLKLSYIDDPVGPENSQYIKNHIGNTDSPLVVCAWGQYGKHLNQDRTVIGWLEESGIHDFRALGFDLKGNPRHPLRMPYGDTIIYDPLL